MNTSVLRAVFARNFVSYFSSATGYVFICLFVFLSSVAAFWPNAFFNDNLANLDQLNYWFPFIMLVFIPAITMGIWAEERREGTDELLLTIPAGDLDIVLGKYLAAVAIYSVSLGFSLVTNYLVLNQLASTGGGLVLAPAIDLGLMLGTYVGYWLVGLAMLAVGMVASFLTRNLTVAYILGGLFNAPLVFAAWAGTILPARAALSVKEWSIGQRLDDFGRGVLSLKGSIYFLAITLVMLYLSMALIGRRHWARRGGGLMSAHYLLRTLALVLIGVGAFLLARRNEVRSDISSARLSSLCRATKDLLADLKGDRPVLIEAFVSPEVPEDYVQTRLNLLNTLREMEALGGERIRVEIISTEPFTEAAARAEQRYQITPREVVNRRRETISVENVFLGVSIRSGLNRVTVPFFDRGVPVEYELIRSICTVLQEKRRRIGVLVTDAPLYGQFNMQTMSPGRNWPVLDELQKQYEVVRVDAEGPIDPKQFDVLLAVQPSSLGPEQMDHFLDAVQSGAPTAIFEDPAPFLAGSVPATSAPRQPPGGMNMMMRQPPPPKGDLTRLWGLLGVSFSPDTIISQKFNPYPKVQEFPEEFVFVDAGDPRQRSFNPDDPISSGLQQVLFPYPGAISKLNSSLLELVPLAETRDLTATVRFEDLVRMTPFGPMGGLNPNPRRTPSNAIYCLAAHITGEVDAPAPAEKDPQNKDADKKGSDQGDSENGNSEKKADSGKTGKAEAKKNAKPAKAKLNVVLVADLDLLAPGFFLLREQGEQPEAGIHFDFDNVTFVLNVLDVLAGDDRFLEIRKRRYPHHTLARIDEQTEEAREATAKARSKFIQDFEDARKKEQEKLEKQVAKLEEQMRSENLDLQEILLRADMVRQSAQKRMNATIETLERDRDKQIKLEETALKEKVEHVQNLYKVWAVVLPPIPPLVLAVAVFFTRRAREREGATRTRLR